MAKKVIWHEMDDCCKEALAKGLLSCPVCKQVFMCFGDSNAKTYSEVKRTQG